ncbi:MAG: YdcF family protein [Acidobacteriota bacterium]|nr:YdcF family protein [Acidobacteriota bacterium]
MSTDETVDVVAKRPRKRHVLLRLLGILLFVSALWFGWVYIRIQAVANRDDARPADAIAVFGAAEYAGRPSPVLHARLDKAVSLYRMQIAPIVITLGGGSDKDSGKTEGGVGRDYLLANGVPYNKIVAETYSIDTEQQVQRLAAIAQRMRLAHIVVVSDGTHLFRIAELCRRAGLDVYTSPRSRVGNIDDYDAAKRTTHEVLSYTALRLDLHISWLHRWLEGKNG